MQITIIGTGYVGLVTGLCFAEFGHKVICVDKDKSKLSLLKSAKSPIYEPNTDVLLEKHLKTGNILFTDDINLSVQSSSAIFIAVGTPTNDEGEAELKYVFQVAAEIAEAIQDDKYRVIITKSTVPVGTSKKIKEIISNNKKANFSIASNPEFLREGSAISDFMNPDRIVIGFEDERTENVMAELYMPLTDLGAPILFTDIASSELIKYASNGFLATKISFINEISRLSEKLGANINDIARGIGLDSRIGMRFLQAGPGFGGSCFPKDTKAIITASKQYNCHLGVIEAALRANYMQHEHMASKIINACGGNIMGKKIAVLGLAFKQNTDDVRYSPAIEIIKILQQENVEISAYDPQGMDNARLELSNISYGKDMYEIASNADCLVIATEWEEFKDINFKQLSSLMSKKIIVDLRNILDAQDVEKAGFEYHCVGI
jgi:UDPglucose 6-dehydrogenase